MWRDLFLELPSRGALYKSTHTRSAEGIYRRTDIHIDVGAMIGFEDGLLRLTKPNIARS